MIGEYIEDFFKIDEYDKHKFLELLMCLKRVEEIKIYWSNKFLELLKQQLIQMNLKALDACSLKSIDKVQLYEVHNHYLHYSIFDSATRQE